VIPVTESIERKSLADLVAAAGPELTAGLGIKAADTGTAYVVLVKALPESAIVVNRTIGLGLGAAASDDEIDAIVAAYHAAGIARYFVHLHSEAVPATLAAKLLGHGLEKTRSWMKFARGRERPPRVATSLEVRRAGPSDASAFGRIVAAAFDLGDAAAPWLAHLVGRPGWHVYMSLAGDEPAGTGTMYVDGEVAWLDWGATDPRFRGRGGQSAILHRRVEDALDLGCRLLLTETGEAVPGDPQHSYNNIVRMGFRPDALRANYAPPRRTAGAP